jgi:hypothetical protein
MKKSTLVIGTIAVAAVVAGGWALAQSGGPPGGLGPAFMRGHGHGGMGPGMTKGMRGQGHGGMGSAMAKGTGGHGFGMTQGKQPGMREPEAAPDADSARK